MILLDGDHLDRRIAFCLIAQRKGILCQEDRIAVEIAGDIAATGGDELVQVHRLSAEIQRQTEKRAISKQTGRPYSACSRSFSTSSCSAPTTPTMAGEPSSGEKSCTTPSSAICCRASFSFFAFIASSRRTRRRISGEKFGTPWKTSCSPSVSVSPMRKRAVVRDADDVAGIGRIGQLALRGEEELRRRQAQLLAGARQPRLHAALQLAGADAGKGDAVAVVRVHVGLDLEDEGRHLVVGRMHGADVGDLVARRRRDSRRAR